ncbi:hypothetical protein ACFE04_012280 [Oxalis oulophora]
MESALCFRYGTPPSLSLSRQTPSVRNSTNVGNSLHFGSRPSMFSLAYASKSSGSTQFTFEKSSVFSMNNSFMGRKIVALPNSASRLSSRDAAAFPKVFCSNPFTNYTPPSGKDTIRALFYIWLKLSTKPNDKPTKLDENPDEANITDFKMYILRQNKKGEVSQLSNAYDRKMKAIKKGKGSVCEVETNLFMALLEVYICLGKFKEAKEEVEKMEKYMQKGKESFESTMHTTKKKAFNLYKAVIYAALGSKNDAKEALDKYVVAATEDDSPKMLLQEIEEEVKNNATNDHSFPFKTDAYDAEAEAEALSSLVRAVLHTIFKEDEAKLYWENKLSNIFPSSY